MQACKESSELIIMDDKPSMRRLTFDNDENEEGDNQMKLVEEYRFTEDLKAKLEGPVSLTEASIFTGIEMYQALKKQTEFKDHSHYDFEIQREKRLEGLRRVGEGYFVSGPHMDLFGGYLAYIS
jgi:hypothetical protein